MSRVCFLAMDPVPYSLQDLADRTSIEPRTIRSYIERGLMPGPDSRGRNAGYSDEHLDRLRALTLLRDASRNLSLEQIRQILQRLKPRQIHDLAEGVLSVADVLETQPERRASSALSYLTELRDGKPMPRGMQGKWSPGLLPQVRKAMVDLGEPQPPAAEEGLQSPAGSPPRSAAHVPDLPPLEQLLASLMELGGPAAPPRSTQTEAWHRIAITPDIELSVRDSFTPEQIVQFQRVADVLRILLTRGVRK